MVWAWSRENLSSGFPTRWDSNQPAQQLKLARDLKMWVKKLKVYYYLSRQQTTKVVIRLHGCTGWSMPLLFAYVKTSFSHDMAHISSPMSLKFRWANKVKSHMSKNIQFHSVLSCGFDMFLSIHEQQNKQDQLRQTKHFMWAWQLSLILTGAVTIWGVQTICQEQYFTIWTLLIQSTALSNTRYSLSY